MDCSRKQCADRLGVLLKLPLRYLLGSDPSSGSSGKGRPGARTSLYRGIRWVCRCGRLLPPEPTRPHDRMPPSVRDWGTGDEYAEVIAAPGSPVRIGPHTRARARCSAVRTTCRWAAHGSCWRRCAASMSWPDSWRASAAARPASWRNSSYPIYARYWPTPRYCTRMRPLAALAAPCLTSTLPAPST